MKHFGSVLAVLGLALAVCAGGLAWSAVAAEKTQSRKADRGKLRHVVLLKFKDSASAEQVQRIEEAFCALPKKIPQIVDFEWGTNNSPEGLNDGFTHCFLITFADEAGRAAYLPHPAHQSFVEILKPHLDKVLVIDYLAGGR